MNRLFLGVFAAMFIVHLGFAQTWYPQIDPGNYWTVGSFGGGQIWNVKKRILTGASTSQDRSIFWSVSLRGVRVNGQYYTLTPSSEWTWDGSDRRCYYGYHTVDGLSKTLGLQYQLFKDGRFWFHAFWTSYYIDNTDQAIIRVDYDLGDPNGFPSLDDIVEYPLEQNGVIQWFASPTDMAYTMPAQPESNGTSIENNAGCRIVDGTSPATQLFAVFFPYVSSSVTFNFMYLGNDNYTLPPSSSNINPLQLTFNNANYQQYAYEGTDQVMYLTLNWPDQNQCPGCSYMGIHGKVYQKPNGRPIRAYAQVMTGAQTPDWGLIVANNRSATNAFNELTSNHFVATNKTGLANPYGTTITLAQLHAFMLNSRPIGQNEYVEGNRDNFRDWFCDFTVVNCTGSDVPSGVIGIMFDNGGTSNNNVEREGAAAYWRTVVMYMTNGPERSRMLMFLASHELGHTFNLQHTWGSCGANFQPPACAGLQSIMTYSFANISNGRLIGNTSMHFYGSGFHGNEGYGTAAAPSELRFFQMGPESWVKPGKFGARWFGTTATTPPSFQDY